MSQGRIRRGFGVYFREKESVGFRLVDHGLRQFPGMVGIDRFAEGRLRSIPSIIDTGVKVILQSKSDVERRMLLRSSHHVTTSVIDHPARLEINLPIE